MKKKNIKISILTFLAVAGILSGCNKNNDKPNEVDTQETVTYTESTNYYSCNYDAKSLRTVPVYDESNNQVGWIWENEYVQVLGSNNIYDYIRTSNNLYCYTEHNNLVRLNATVCNYFAFLCTDTEAYDGPNSSLYQKTGDVIETNQKVFVIKSYEYYSLVEDEQGRQLYVPNSNLIILPDTFIETDISKQTSYYYVNNELVFSFPVTTGTDDLPTPEGYYSVTSYKTENKTLKNGAHADYWIPFIGDLYGYHDASWRPSSDYGTDAYHDRGSHGCINTPYSDVVELYNNVSVGTKVLIHK